MATATKDKANDLSSLLGVSAVEDVDPSKVRIQSGRGRQKGDDVLAIRDILRECVKNQTAKVFTITEGENGDKTEEAIVKQKNKVVSKIRSAAKGGSEDNDNPDLSVGTAWDAESHRLYFGPQSAIDKMMGKAQKTS